MYKILTFLIFPLHLNVFENSLALLRLSWLPVNQNNFLVSNIFNLEIGDNSIPTIKSIQNIVFTIRTFIVGTDMDQVLEKQ